MISHAEKSELVLTFYRDKYLHNKMAKRGLSRKEIEEQKKREEIEAAAEVEDKPVNLYFVEFL